MTSSYGRRPKRSPFDVLDYMNRAEHLGGLSYGLWSNMHDDIDQPAQQSYSRRWPKLDGPHRTQPDEELWEDVQDAAS